MESRLPKRFEDEILAVIGYGWNENFNAYVNYSTKTWEKMGAIISDYEIAMRGLEAMLDKKLNKEFDEAIEFARGFIGKGEPLEGYYEICDYKTAADKDFCQCIFKAIEEIWG